MPQIDPRAQQQFATEVVRRLRAAGFEAYWAGGCVRDRLLGRLPKDYDVATNATPPEIRAVFRHRKTLAIGAAFGVITVVGHRGSGSIEVATFRRDESYSDGRHPDRVTFCSAREDALRRDFTINGLFFDPLAEKVIDYVGGQEDLRRGVVRAIGQPAMRFAEDKLRMLRAVRFAATFGFVLEAETLAAIRQMAEQITVVSPERIAMEMRRMLVEPGRKRAVALLLESRLAAALLPEIVPTDAASAAALERALTALDKLPKPGFPLALATLLHERVEPAAAMAICRRWRLTNKETQRVVWLLKHRHALAGARHARWSLLQPLIVAPGIRDLLALAEVAALADPEDLAHCYDHLARPWEQLDPPPLVTGDDLVAWGIPPGPRYARLLRRLRAAQLDGEIHDKAEGRALLERLRQGE
jgi:tRNA nucleotidyltransferase/poly(A) polymerase